MSQEKNKIISQEDIMNVLDTCYEKALNGISKVSPPIEEFAQDYLSKSKDRKSAARSMLKAQIVKCTTSGFLTGFGGLITMPITVPANIGSVLYVQIRMIACTAYLAGFDVKSDQVQTFVYACLAGVSVNNLVKKKGVDTGLKIAKKIIDKIPGETLKNINKKVGIRVLTKNGEKGVINLGKMVPGVGAIIGGGCDLVETKIIANRAYKMFFEGDFSAGNN